MAFVKWILEKEYAKYFKENIGKKISTESLIYCCYSGSTVKQTVAHAIEFTWTLVCV